MGRLGGGTVRGGTMRTGKHWTKRVTPRLQGVLDAIRAAGPTGASIIELVKAVGITDPAGAVAELRRLGYGIVSTWDRGRNGRPYVRYVFDKKGRPGG